MRFPGSFIFNNVVIENGGTSLYRIQAIEKCHFSMAC